MSNAHHVLRRYRLAVV